jgi:hypothetical protein
LERASEDETVSGIAEREFGLRLVDGGVTGAIFEDVVSGNRLPALRIGAIGNQGDAYSLHVRVGVVAKLDLWDREGNTVGEVADLEFDTVFVENVTTGRSFGIDDNQAIALFGLEEGRTPYVVHVDANRGRLAVRVAPRGG